MNLQAVLAALAAGQEELEIQAEGTAPGAAAAFSAKDRDMVVRVTKALTALLYPRYFSFDEMTSAEILLFLEEVLPPLLSKAFSWEDGPVPDCCRLAEDYLAALPDLLGELNRDAEAIFEGDPAAVSPQEVVLCYPGFYAICLYRLAHALLRRGVPLLPRIMTEYAHAKTGIDIHPGARIGSYFCIDHGTGIVIGETAVIGDHVKLYQGVTIGARSFAKDEAGRLVKCGRRHPTIGNGVVIYANATILGGDTVIGDGAVIGSSAWIMHSVEPGAKIAYPGELCQ